MACEGWRSFVPSFFPILAKFTFGKIVRALQRSAEKIAAFGVVIGLDTTPKQAAHCRRACGTKRYAYNWGLTEWQS
jgi:hypothetical protein